MGFNASFTSGFSPRFIFYTTTHQTTPMTTLDHIGIYVKNLEESLRFYKDVFDFPVKQDEDRGDVRICLLDIDRHSLAVENESGTEKVLFAKAIIATGSHPSALPGLPEVYLTPGLFSNTHASQTVWPCSA